jgi:hypothetical protein
MPALRVLAARAQVQRAGEMPALRKKGGGDFVSREKLIL